MGSESESGAGMAPRVDSSVLLSAAVVDCFIDSPAPSTHEHRHAMHASAVPTDALSLSSGAAAAAAVPS